uniref:Uncharacterized protein n=1 Tax=Anguilla anguilla TaxID=7936 RepID=A0A0E9QUK4_ANGAN
MVWFCQVGLEKGIHPLILCYASHP